MKFGKKPRWLAGAAVSSTVLAVCLAGMPSGVATTSARPSTGGSAAQESSGARTPAHLDRRHLSQKAALKADRAQVRGRSSADRAFLRSLGPQAVIDIDALTGTPRNLGRLDGYLTGKHSGSARSIALDFVRSHLDVLGLSSADLSTLRFRKDAVDNIGLHHLSWTQVVDGIPVFGNGLKVKVTRDGRILAVQGSPVAGLTSLARSAPSASRMTAAQARAKAAADVGGRAASAAVARSSSAGTTWKNRDFAKRVWFVTPAGLRPGWSTYVQAGAAGSFQHVVDAASGAVLFRRSTVDHADGDAYVYDNYPGAAAGGQPKVVNLFKAGFLKKSATFLSGTSVVAWADLDDDNAIGAGEKTPVPGTAKKAQFKLVPMTTTASDFCSKKFVCTWDPNTAYSWKKNMKADVTQAFYLASNFTKWLQKSSVGFTPAMGNFTAAGKDPILLNALDGANASGDGFPDGNHIDNANMDTPPDGTPPTMQMYLWHVPGTTDAEDPFVPTSSAFDASVEYHEYTHGLSNRLVVDATGNSTLNDIQAGSMGEAWSDYYAMDYLVSHGFVKDTSKAGEVFEGYYLMGGVAPFRTMAIDCPVAATAAGCGTSLDGVPGGYTYGDFPTIGGGPEVHSSGELWAQTLWDIRKALGSKVANTVITRAMSISADDPSMLDMRDAVIQADTVAFGATHRSALWQIFAKRGMGFYAGALDSSDTTPADDFHVPPPSDTPRTTISGIVTDPTTGDPVAGAVVRVAGQGDNAIGVTAADGTFQIPGLYAGTYAKVVATAPGYLSDEKAVDSTSPTPATFSIVRDWAASSGGASVSDFNGPDYTDFGCGPGGAIDLSLSTGWGSTTGDDDGTPTNVFVPKFVVVDMHQAVDITKFGVDPTATCGDGGSASTGEYKIETSPDGTTWTTAATGTFTSADRGQLNDVVPTAGATGVRYVKFTALSNQTPDFATNCPDGPYSGCSFTDMSELAVFGAATP